MDARIHSTVCPAKVVFVLFATREFVVPCVENKRVLRATKRICIHVVYALIPFARNAKFLQVVQSVMLVSAMNARSQYNANFATKIFAMIAITESNVPFAEKEDVPTVKKTQCIHVAYARIPFAWTAILLQDVRSVMLVSATNARSQ